MSLLNSRLGNLCTRCSPRQRLAATGILLALLAVIPYLNTLEVPWYFDDVNNIVDNPLVRDLPRALRNIFVNRGLAILTFALNHYFGGLNLAGYHLVNLLIHAGSVVVVWLLLRRLLVDASPWAEFGALLFALHPVQTQAVTYVVQRMTSLSGLCFLLAVLSYLISLDSPAVRRRYYWLAVVWGALAVLVKENAAVLPVLLLLVERYFRRGRSWREQLVALLPFCLAPLWKVVEMLLLPLWRGDVAASIRYADQLQTMQNVTPLRYLFTEFSVFWHYFRLLVAPFDQRLDYGWPVVERLITVQNLAALAGLLALWGLAWWLRLRRPLLSCGIAWFFLTLSIESSLIPLDPIFEHRLYLPLFGVALIATDLWPRLPWVKLQLPAAVLLLLVLALLTWQRNALWNDQVAFFEANQRLSPDNVRVMVMLGNAYAAQKRPEEGLRVLERALARNPRYDFCYTALGKILIDRGEGGKAIPALKKGVQLYPDSVVLNEYLGIAYGMAGEFEPALTHLRHASRLQPDDASVYTNLGVLYSLMGDNRQAVDNFERARQLVPDSEKTLFNLASALYALGENRQAFEVLRAVVAVNPDNADAQFGRGTLAVQYGSRADAEAALAALRRLGDERAAELAAQLGRGR